MFAWLREYFDIKREASVCQSCETLRQQLEIANYEKEKLLNKLLEDKPEPVERIEPVPMVTRPNIKTWAIRRQMLEQEDRVKAQILRNTPKPDNIEELEKDLGVKNGT